MKDKQLLEIIACALKEKKYTKPINDEKITYIQARENGLLPLLFVGLDKELVSKEFYEKLEKKYFANIYLDNFQQALIIKIGEIFTENKFEHLFVKGTHLKSLYKESHLRPMGDIDVLIRRKNTHKARKIFKRAGFSLYAKSAQHDVYYFKNNMVEVHRAIYKKDGRKDASFLANTWDYVKQESGYKYRLDYTYEGIYLLYHLKKHMLYSGIGFRSILDISIFFNYYQAEIDKSFLETELNNNNFTKFFQTILYLNKQAFNLDSPFLDKEFKIETEDYEKMLDYINTSGIHGKGKDFNIMAPLLTKKNKFKTFLRLVFPTWPNMKEAYGWLRYLPFLLPVAYVLRGLKFLFLKTKYTFYKLIKIKQADQEIKDLDEVFKKMGL